MTAIKRAYKKRYDADFIEDLRYKNKHPTTDVLVELTNRSAPMQSKGKVIHLSMSMNFSKVCLLL